MTAHKKNLYYLYELPDYQITSDCYDVRGWDVLDTDNRNVGKVESLLVSKRDMKVVYLDVEVLKSLIEVGYETGQVSADEGVHGFINKAGEDHLLVPIGMVNLDIKQKKVLTRQIDRHTFAKAKKISRGAEINPEYEFKLFSHYIRDDTIDKTILSKKFYKRKEFANTLVRRDSE